MTDDLPRARALTKARRSPRGWGKVRKLPSGRFQASYLDAAGNRRTAPATFGTRLDADAWLSRQRAALDAGTWRNPDRWYHHVRRLRHDVAGRADSSRAPRRTTGPSSTGS